MRSTRVILAALSCCIACAASAPEVLAHAGLVSSVPAAEAVLDAPPERLRLRFSNRVAFPDDAVRLLDAEGRPVAVDAPGGTGKALEVDLPPGLGDGSYAVAWHVIDDHRSSLTGALNFHVGAAPAQPPVPAAPRTVRTASDELRDLSRTGLGVSVVALLAALGVFAARRRRPEGALALTAGQAALACCVLAGGATVALGGEPANAPPPPPGTHTARLASGNVAEVNISPPRVGAPRVTVEVRAANGQADFALDRLEAELTHTGRRLGPYTIEFPRREIGRFAPDRLTFPFPGRWRVELSLKRGEFDSERVVFDQEISE